MLDIPERISRRIKKLKNGCWEWQGAHDKQGYGHVFFKKYIWKIHRLFFKLETGKDPKNLCVLHRCDYPPCCNPSHLFLGTRTQNAADRVAKGRGDCARGSSKPNSILTEDIVRELRKKYNSRTSRFWGGKELAEKYGINPSALSAAVRGTNWRNL